MASPVHYSTDRPQGPDHSVEWVRFGNRDKKLALSRGYSENRVTIIGDSLIQKLEKFLYCSVQGIPGAYLKDMVAMCTQGLYDVSSFRAVVIMTGTNDFSRDCTQNQMLAMYTAVILHIRSINPSAQIAIGGILPRPCDATDPKTFHRIQSRITFNTALLLHCKASGVAYFKTEKALKGKGSDSYLYYTDLLHLSDDGLFFLQKWLEGRIACLIGAPPQNMA
jgi:hypothetical protein